MKKILIFLNIRKYIMYVKNLTLRKILDITDFIRMFIQEYRD